MSLRDGLVVVIPRRFSLKRIQGVLEQSRAWLERTASLMEARRRLMESGPRVLLPEHISLPAIGEEWTVAYRATDSPRVMAAERDGNCLILFGNSGDVAACRAALERWLNRKGHQNLEPWLVSLADEHGFELKRVVVRSQRTRWGSYSRFGTVSLNVRLMFLPEELARHVLIHELCHTVHLNHSRRFKALLEQHEPGSKGSRARLREAWSSLPAWLDVSPLC